MVVMFKQTQHQYTCTLMLVVAALLVACTVPVCRADDYDDEGYGNQGGGAGGDGGGGGGGSSGAGNSNQVNDNDNYQNGYGNDDGYSGSMPNYQQQNVDSDSSNNSPSSNYSPQSGSDSDGDYEGDDGSAAAAAAASSPEPSVVRIKRAAGDNNEALLVKSSEPLKDLAVDESVVPKLRAKRHAKYYIGPVYTYVKTDKHANFKWGVKHKVGKKHYG